MDAIAALLDALDRLLLAGPDAHSPLERERLFDARVRAALPPRVAAAIDRVVDSGQRADLLDALAWARGAAASRAQLARGEGDLRAVLPAILQDDPVETWSFERWFAELVARGPAMARAASLLAASDRAWLDAQLRARISAAGPTALDALEPLLSLLGATRESSDHWTEWASHAIPAQRAPLLLARARSGAMEPGDARAWMAMAIEHPWTDEALTECLRALLASQPALAGELLFARLARSQRASRAEYERALLAMTSHFEQRFVPWIEARLASGEASPWELDALDRWLARNRRTRGV